MEEGKREWEELGDWNYLYTLDTMYKIDDY